MMATVMIFNQFDTDHSNINIYLERFEIYCHVTYLFIFFFIFKGKRMCLGDELGRMLLFLFGAGILHQFSLSIPGGAPVDLDGECGITLTPKPYKLHLVPRFTSLK